MLMSPFTRSFVLGAIAISLAGCAATNAPVPEAGPLILGPHSPYAIAIGPDHNIWFTEYQGSNIGMMTPNGEVMKFPIGPDALAERITSGPDGALWFTDPKGNRIGRIGTDGKIQYIKLPQAECGPSGIVTGGDGFIYFTEHAANRIGRLRTDGTLTEFTLPNKSGPASIVSGHDGAVYFAEDESNHIAKIDKNGAVRESPIPTAQSVPSAIAIGPDGSIYFAEVGPGKIGKMKFDGSIDEYQIPRGKPLGLATGADGNLWATSPGEHLVYRMTSGGDFIGYRLVDSIFPAFIAAAPDGNLYFTEPSGKVGRISTDGDVTEFDVNK